MRNFTRREGSTSTSWPRKSLATCWAPLAFAPKNTAEAKSDLARAATEAAGSEAKHNCYGVAFEPNNEANHQETPALRTKGKSSISQKARKSPSTPGLEAPGPAALSAFALFVLKHLPARWNAELRCQSSQKHLMTCKAVCQQTPCKWRGCLDHLASSLPEADHQISCFYLDTKHFGLLRNSPQQLLSNHWSASPPPPDLDMETQHDCRTVQGHTGPAVMISFGMSYAHNLLHAEGTS